ncbi:MAG: DUF126 domain-containing protein [Crenarchaeota archaeon]|nr:DUF126 domain-containing protein [Thermoproteota archaeon]
MCRVIYMDDSRYRICGRAVKLSYITLLGDLDPETGTLSDGRSIRDRVLVYIQAVGSTVGSYVLYALAKRGNKPRAVLCVELDHLTLVGCVLGGIDLFQIGKEEYDRVVEGSEICVEVDKINREECHIAGDE